MQASWFSAGQLLVITSYFPPDTWQTFGVPVRASRAASGAATGAGAATAKAARETMVASLKNCMLASLGVLVKRKL